MGFKYKTIYFKSERLKLLATEYQDLEIRYKQNSAEFCYSYGAYALKILDRLLAQGSIEKVHLRRKDKIQLRMAYTGGRNEYIQEPNKNFNLYSIDFRTMYLHCLNSEFLVGEITRKEVKHMDRPGFYYVSYTSPLTEYPILYKKNPLNEQNYFCIGHGEGLFWYEEIELFLSEGGIIHKIHYCFWGADYRPNYKPYIETINKFKTEKSQKLLANHLYGKLAMKDYFYQCRLYDETEFLLRNSNNLVGRYRQ